MEFKKSQEGSSLQLLQFSLAYFFFYVLTGIAVKYFQGPLDKGFPGIPELSYLFFSTAGSSVICLGAIIFLGWYKKAETSEIPYIVLSGICTAIVIPTTTLMYSLPISVMVAMVIMRGSIIFISRIVDMILLAQGLSKKIVSWEENLAVVIALCAVGTNLVNTRDGDFAFLQSPVACSVLGSYIVAYGIRIYLMNYFKNTRSDSKRSDNKSYFAVEQLCAFFTLVFICATIFAFKDLFPEKFQDQIASIATTETNIKWLASVSGIPFGMAAFFSVFLFMFKGRSSTFSGLVNRLSSLIAGTTATLIFAATFGGKYPSAIDWASFGLVLVSVALLVRAELKHHK